MVRSRKLFLFSLLSFPWPAPPLIYPTSICPTPYLPPPFTCPNLSLSRPLSLSLFLISWVCWTSLCCICSLSRRQSSCSPFSWAERDLLRWESCLSFSLLEASSLSRCSTSFCTVQNENKMNSPTYLTTSLTKVQHQIRKSVGIMILNTLRICIMLRSHDLAISLWNRTNVADFITDTSPLHFFNFCCSCSQF